MSPDERARRLQRLQEIDAQLEQERMMDPKGVAGAFHEPIVVGDKPPVVQEPKGFTQKATELVAPIAASMYGAKKGAQVVAPIAAMMPNPMVKAGVTAAGAIGGAALSGATADMTLGGIKEVMGLPGAPDSIDKVYQSAKDAAWEQGVGEGYGQFLIGPVTSRLAPFRRALQPESAELLSSMANRVRAAYEEIGGKPLVEETRAWWNPGRVMVPLETELRDDAVYARLRDAGMDPEVARKVAVTGGASPTRLDQSITSRYWAQVSGSKMVPDEAYEKARAKLLHYSTLEDLGSHFADQLPPEQMGATVIGALNGRFDTLNGARETAMNTLQEKLPVGLKIDISGFKQSLGAPAPLKGSSKTGLSLSGLPAAPKSTRPGAGLILNLPDEATFDQINKQRTALASMSRDTRIPQAQRDDIKNMVWELDNATRDALPVRQRGFFRKYTQADDEMNKGGFDNAFVLGLLRKEENARLYAEKIIKNKDAANFGRLETALKGAPDGPRIIGQVKSSIAERFFEGAVNQHGILDPSQLTAALGTQTKGYGKYFLEATLGPEYVQGLNRYIKAMSTVDEATAKAGNVVRAGATLAGSAFSINSLLRGAPGVAGATVPATIAAAVFSPAVVSKALTHPIASKLLIKTAENVAAGRNPMTTARLAGRVLEMTGVTLESLYPDQVITPKQQAAATVQRGVVGAGIPTGQPLPATGGAMVPGT